MGKVAAYTRLERAGEQYHAMNIIARMRDNLNPLDDPTGHSKKVMLINFVIDLCKEERTKNIEAGIIEYNKLEEKYDEST